MHFPDTHLIIRDGLRTKDLRDLDSASLVFGIEDAIGQDSQLRNAMSLAALAHRHQTRPGRHGMPEHYITHPLRNTLRNIRFGCTDVDVLAATALHDTVEDQPEQVVQLLHGDESSPAREEALRQLDAHFGSTVANIVEAVSNPPKPADLSRAEQHELYAAHVMRTVTDPRVFLVKVSDFLDNAGSLDALQDADTRNRLRTKYAPLVQVFVRAAEVHGDALELGQAGYEHLVAELHALASALQHAA